MDINTLPRQKMDCLTAVLALVGNPTRKQQRVGFHLNDDDGKSKQGHAIGRLSVFDWGCDGDHPQPI